MGNILNLQQYLDNRIHPDVVFLISLPSRELMMHIFYCSSSIAMSLN